LVEDEHHCLIFLHVLCEEDAHLFFTRGVWCMSIPGLLATPHPPKNVYLFLFFMISGARGSLPMHSFPSSSTNILFQRIKISCSRVMHPLPKTNHSTPYMWSWFWWRIDFIATPWSIGRKGPFLCHDMLGNIISTTSHIHVFPFSLIR